MKPDASKTDARKPDARNHDDRKCDTRKCDARKCDARKVRTTIPKLIVTVHISPGYFYSMTPNDYTLPDTVTDYQVTWTNID